MISPLGFIEYAAPDNVSWRIDCGREMLKDFKIAGPEDYIMSQVVRWHEALSDQSQIWLIVRRLFAVTPMYGVEDPEEMRPWKMDRIAAHMKISVREVEGGFAEAKAFWSRWQNASGPPVEPEAPEPTIEDMGEAEMDKLLLENGFVGLDDPHERRYCARRILELESILDDEGQRALGRALIEQEMTLFFSVTPALRGLQTIVKTLHKGVPTESQESRMLKLVASRGNLQEQIQATMKALGITEAQLSSMKVKRNFRDCLGTLVSAVQAYEARGDRTLIDGVFTAAEIEMLTEEFTARPFQYRPDVVMVVPDCIERLFDPAFEPAKIGRRAHRKLLAGFKQGLANARAEEGATISELDPESTEDRSEALADQAERDGDSALLSASMAASINRTAPPPRPAAASRKAESSDLADY